MASVLYKLIDKELITPPHWFRDNLIFEGDVGSKAYGCQEHGHESDLDIASIVMPPKNFLFPHLDGHVNGFGKIRNDFKTYQQHHIEFKEMNCQVDILAYGISQFFHLAADNNPNVLELLFIPEYCIRHETSIYQHIRKNRSLFVHKGCYHKFRGYAYQQLKKLDAGGERKSKRRQESIEKYGFDTKFCYHIVRLLLECEQLLETGKMRLDRDARMYKAVRNGEWTVEQVKEFFYDKSPAIEKLYDTSDLQYEPDREQIRSLLVECIEIHYGRITKTVDLPTDRDRFIVELEEVISKYK